MGTLRSKTNRAGLVVNGVTLGSSVLSLLDGTPPQPGDQVDDLWFIWDDAAFPTGVVRASGTVDVDDPEPL